MDITFDFYANEVNRIFETLKNTSPATPEYGYVLQNLERFDAMAGGIEAIVNYVKSIQGQQLPAAAPVAEFTPPTDTEPKPEKTEDPEPKEEKPAKTEKKAEKKIELPQVREKLSFARKTLEDFSVKSWLRENYNVENASAIPEDKYAEVIEKIDLLLAEAE